jgi:hypothetical protein
MPEVPAPFVPSSPTIASSGRSARRPSTMTRLGARSKLGDDVGLRRLGAAGEVDRFVAARRPANGDRTGVARELCSEAAQAGDLVGRRVSRIISAVHGRPAPGR